MRPFAAQLTALGAALAVIVGVSAGWIVHLRGGDRLDGFEAGPMTLAVPVGLVGLTTIWLLARALTGWGRRWSFLVVLFASAAFAYAAVAATCGPVACFEPGPNRLIGWFVAGGVVAAALAHHIVREMLRST